MLLQQDSRCHVVTFFLGASLVACADGTSSPDGVHVDEVLRLELVEEIRIGSVTDPEVGFSRIGPVHVTADGTMLVAETQDQQIRVYDDQGRLINRLGRLGDGPGEFRSIGRLGVIGDTIWASEGRWVTLFTRDGRLLGTVSGQVRIPVPTPAGYIPVYPDELRPDGFFLSSVGSAIYPNLPERTWPVPRLLFDASGAVVDTIEYLETEISRPAIEVPHSTGRAFVYLEPTPADSSEKALAGGDDSVKIRWRVPVSAADGVFEVIRTSGTGDTIYWTRFRYEPRPVLTAYLDSLAAQRAAMYRADSARIHQAARDALQMPPYHVPISSQRAGDDGAIWIRPNDGSPPTNRWVILDSAGGIRGAVELPPRTVIRFSRGEHLWVSEPDEFDVPWFVRYRLEVN